MSDPIALREMFAWMQNNLSWATDYKAITDAADEIERLRAFARRIMRAWPDGDVDGGELQEAAVEAGILRETRPREACGDNCWCADYYGSRDFGEGHVVCYRIVRGALGDE